MAINYAYQYAVLGNLTNGRCTQVLDTSEYILDPAYVPVSEYNRNYALKYYWPIPEAVTSFDDFQGQWYSDAAHTIPWSPA